MSPYRHEYFVRLIRKPLGEFPISRELTRSKKWVSNSLGGLFTLTEVRRIESNILRSIKNHWTHRQYYRSRGISVHRPSAYTLLIELRYCPKSHTPTVRNVLLRDIVLGG